MVLEQVFKCSRTLSKYRDGPLGGLMDGFCNALIEDGFSKSTIRRHLSNVAHLNAYLGARKKHSKQALRMLEVSEFLRDYPAQARHHGSLDKHIACVKNSVNRLLDYLLASGHFENATLPEPLYQPLLVAYLEWLKESQHAAPGTIELRSHSIIQFLQWLGPLATADGCSELNPEMVEHFFLTEVKDKGHSARRSMQAALRTFLRFCLQRGYIQQPLDLAVPRCAVTSLWPRRVV